MALPEVTYEDRLGDLGIFTPDLEFFEPDYTDFEIVFIKKTSAYDFGETPKQLIQDFGLGAVNIPLTVFFAGNQYDKKAAKFTNSILEKGNTELFHPIYGTFDVVVTKVTRRDALVNGRGQAIFVIEMSETIIPDRPASGTETRGVILEDMSSLEAINSGVFSVQFFAGLVGDIIAAKNRITGFIGAVRKGFESVLATVASIQAEFDNLERSLISNLDFFLSFPGQLATQLQRLIATPARIANNVQDRVEIYRALYEGLLNPAEGSSISAAGTALQDIKNQNAEKQLLTTAILAGISESLLFPENEPDPSQDTGETLGFLTQGDAINSAADLATDYIEIQDFLDEQQKSDESTPIDFRFDVSDEVTSLIKKITASTTARLIELSFTLKKEKIIEVQAETNFIDLCFELYGTTEDGDLDFLIQTIGLTGEELLTIPKGKLIKSYA